MRKDRLIAPALVFLVVGSYGCVDLTPLRDKDYGKVTIPQIEHAAYSDDDRVYQGLVGLVEKHVADPENTDLDNTLEALAALGTLRRPESIDVLVRCVREDTNEDVRYMGLDVLLLVDPDGSFSVIEKVAVSDPSDIVREHARELLISQGSAAADRTPGARSSSAVDA